MIPVILICMGMSGTLPAFPDETFGLTGLASCHL